MRLYLGIDGFSHRGRLCFAAVVTRHKGFPHRCLSASSGSENHDTAEVQITAGGGGDGGGGGGGDGGRILDRVTRVESTPPRAAPNGPLNRRCQRL